MRPIWCGQIRAKALAESARHEVQGSLSENQCEALHMKQHKHTILIYQRRVLSRTFPSTFTDLRLMAVSDVQEDLLHHVAK